MAESFVFYKSFIDAVEIEGLAEQDQLQILKAIIHYALSGQEPDSNSSISTRLAFRLIKPQIDANNVRRENGFKGGRPKKNKTIGFETETNGYENKTIGFEKTKTEKPNVNDNENYNVNANDELLMSKKVKTKRFVKPDVEEIKAYCIERNNNIDAECFFDYYEANGWKVSGNAMKDWKATVRNWERNEKARNKNTSPIDYNNGDYI